MIGLPLDCPGCTGCSIRRQLNERETFTRKEMAHLLALAFRSGASLAYEMAGDIARWADEPFVRRTARQQYERRLAESEASAARGREVDRLARERRDQEAAERILAGPYESDAEWLADVTRRQGRITYSDMEWPEVVAPGSVEARAATEAT